MTSPDQHLIDKAIAVATSSHCRSKRGVLLWDPTGAIRGVGYNGPPDGFTCPGSDACRGTCGLRSVHAEMRALDEARRYLGDVEVARQLARRVGTVPTLDLLHVELAPDGGVLPCDGPTCPQCSKHIVECGFVGRVWLYVARPVLSPDDPAGAPREGRWIAYDVAEFHRLSLIANGVRP